MNLNYEITAFDARGQVTVKYWHDDIKDDAFYMGIDLPIEDGRYPTGSNLESLVLRNAPARLLGRKVALVSVANATDIASLIGTKSVIVVDPLIPDNWSRPGPGNMVQGVMPATI